MFTVLKPNLEAILIDINQYINIDSERQVYATHFESLKNLIFCKLRASQPFGYLFNGYQMGGSYGDNLKVTKPNEFDLVFHIQFPENKLIDVEEDHNLPGNVHLKFTRVNRKIRNEQQNAIVYRHLQQWLDDDDRLIIDKLQSYFQSCFTKALEDMNYRANLCNEYTSLRYCREGPAHTIKVRGDKMTYSVDFVPGLLLDETQSVMPTHVGQWEAIPKPIRGARRNYTSFRSSFYRQEQKLIKDNNNLKNALRMMKKFRDAHQNMSNMKSYFIKTLFLWKAKEEQGTTYWRSSLTRIIKDMFKAMEESLHKQELPFFWDRRLNMYEPLSSMKLREMLGCVVNTRKTLEEASLSLTLPRQKRVYAIFLNQGERTPTIQPECQDEYWNYDEPQSYLIPKEKKNEPCCTIL